MPLGSLLGQYKPNYFPLSGGGTRREPPRRELASLSGLSSSGNPPRSGFALLVGFPSSSSPSASSSTRRGGSRRDRPPHEGSTLVCIARGGTPKAMNCLLSSFATYEGCVLSVSVWLEQQSARKRAEKTVMVNMTTKSERILSDPAVEKPLQFAYLEEA